MAGGARELATKVLAGDPLASTAPETLRILAAAVTAAATHRQPAPIPAAQPGEDIDERREEGRAD